MTIKKIIIPILLLLIGNISVVLYAQPLEQRFEAMMKNQFPSQGPGASVIVAKGDKIIFTGGFGKANLELGVDNTADHVFEIGSITKQFTAVCILMLMEEGKLNLQDDITKFIKDYPTHGHKITIHHLLTHTSGIKSYTSMSSFIEKARQDMNPDDLIDEFKNQPMDFAPGEKWLYNNSAYVILGHIIETISGGSYEDFVQKNIFDPLGMSSSYYGSHSRIIKNRAYGYQQRDEVVNADYLSLTLPYSAGSIMSTVGDLYKWQNAIKTNKLISAESLRLATMDHPLNNGDNTDYGYGWGVNKINGSPTYEHSGGIFGYNSNAIYLPEEDVYVAVLANSDFISSGEISTRIAAHAIGKPYPEITEKISLEQSYLEKLVGIYDFEDKTIRTITLEEGQLMSQREGSQKIPIHAIDNRTFIYEGSLSSIIFDISPDEKVVAHFSNRNSKTTGQKTSREIKERVEIEVEENILKQYVGEYELQPGFIISFSIEDGKMMTQATGQPKFQVFAETSSKFYLKVVPAEIEFMKNEKGEYDSLVLHQGGREMRAVKIK
jgi:CubicO group peptidase (beta-lactamase class C family)